MANGTDSRMNFQDYKKLTQEERDFFVFDKMCKIDEICDTLAGLEKKFAAKWVERIMQYLGITTIGAVVTAILAMVINTSKP